MDRFQQLQTLYLWFWFGFFRFCKFPLVLFCCFGFLVLIWVWGSEVVSSLVVGGFVVWFFSVGGLLVVVGCSYKLFTCF